MRNSLLLCLILLIANHSIAQKKKYSLTGKLNTDFSGTLYLTIDQEKHELSVANGEFNLKGKIERSALVMLRTANTSCPAVFYLDTGNVVIDLAVEPHPVVPVPCVKLIKVTGSPAHDLFMRFNMDLAKARRNSLAEQGKALAATFNTYLDQAPDFSYIPQALYQYSSGIELPDLEIIFEKLPKHSKASMYGGAVLKKIEQKKITQPGTLIQTFDQRDVKGKKVSIKDFAGKPVLIDFWASWCGPCRAENPNLVKAYERFHPKGLEILGVSLDEDKAAWLEAIKNDKLEWKQVSDLMGWQNEVAKKFKVSAIPFNILLDAEGKIVATNLTGNALHIKLQELLK